MRFARDDIEQAARWLVRSRKKDFSGSEQAELQKWLESDTAHKAAFAEFESIWDKAGLAKTLFESEKNTCSQQNKKCPLTILPPWSQWGQAALGLCMIFLCLLLPSYIDHTEPRKPARCKEFVCAPGQQKTVSLEDGTNIEMNVGTRLKVCLFKTQRQVIMQSGEAFFDVSTDTDRPFMITTPQARVNVLGTAFNLKNRHGLFALKVARGKVRVTARAKAADSVLLLPGQSVRVTAAGQMEDVLTCDTGTLLQWKKGWVDFDNAPLFHVFDELSSWHPQRQRIYLSGVENKRISGRFDMRRFEQTLRTIAYAASLRIVRNADGSLTLFERKTVP